MLNLRYDQGWQGPVTCIKRMKYYDSYPPIQSINCQHTIELISLKKLSLDMLGILDNSKTNIPTSTTVKIISKV